MNSERPYLLRALYQWVVDNGCTPHMLVSTSVANVQVPIAFVQDNRITLNIAPAAVRDFEIGTHKVSFHGRFGNRSEFVEFPVGAVLAIYARENGRGMVFEAEETPTPPTPKLRVVK